VRVLEHLAARPDTPRSATEIARELGIARATCALVLEELTALGWLIRTEDGYVLGPQIVPVGRAALHGAASAGGAHDELVALAADLGLVCTTAAVLGDSIAVLDRAGPTDEHRFEVRVGMRFAFVPPLGIVNVAWEPDHAVTAWLRRSPRPLADDDEARLWAVVREVRRTGVHIERLTEHVFRLQSVLANLSTEDLPDGLRRAVGDALAPLASRAYRRGDLRPGGTYSLSRVVAPTFDSDGRQRLVVAAFVGEADVPYDDVMRIATRVRQAADRVTEWAGGVDPWDTASATRGRAARARKEASGA
jgi:DNA-binding IclR family transcriptional regulator